MEQNMAMAHLQARMIAAATTVGAASTSSFAAISYTSGEPALETAQPVCDIGEVREQLSSPQTPTENHPIEMDTPAPVPSPFQLSTLVNDNNCVERLLPEMLVAEDPEPICGLPACFHAGDACAVAVIHWSATVDLRSMYERAVFAEVAEAPVLQECALPTRLHQGDSCAVAIIDPSETIDLETIHELVVLAEQAKQAMAMLRGAADLKRVKLEWDALEGRSSGLAEDASDDEGFDVDVDAKVTNHVDIGHSVGDDESVRSGGDDNGVDGDVDDGDTSSDSLEVGANDEDNEQVPNNGGSGNGNGVDGDDGKCGVTVKDQENVDVDVGIDVRDDSNKEDGDTDIDGVDIKDEDNVNAPYNQGRRNDMDEEYGAGLDIGLG